MRVVITGGTGFIGRSLVPELLNAGHSLTVLSRSASSVRRAFESSVTPAEWNGHSPSQLMSAVEGADAVINLAGENIASGRWSGEKKKRILQSRVDAGKAIAEAMVLAKNKPSVLIQASAIGYYGSQGTKRITETSEPGTGFLAHVCKQWERSSESVEQAGMRRVIIRSGVVLGAGGGALSKMIAPFRLFSGGHLGNGTQGVSWIHKTDEVRAIRFLMETESVTGPYNLVSPSPVDARTLARQIGRALERPSWFHVPAVALKAAYGEMADEALLCSQFAYPKRLLEEGFEFTFPGLPEALSDILK